MSIEHQLPATPWRSYPGTRRPSYTRLNGADSPYSLRLALPYARLGVSRPRPPLRDLVCTPAAHSALAVMATGQVVMVAVMTAAPLDMHMRGEGLSAVGTVLSAHTLGMFGAVDAAVWGAAAAASLASTAILAAGGYAVLAGAAGVLAVLPATVSLGRRRPGTPSRPEGAQSASRPDCPVLSPAEEDFPLRPADADGMVSD